jgi:hypothetical protein
VFVVEYHLGEPTFFNPDFPFSREAMLWRFGMQFSRHLSRRIGDTPVRKARKVRPERPTALATPHKKSVFKPESLAKWFPCNNEPSSEFEK